MTAAERKAIGSPPVKKLHVDPRDFLTLGKMYEAERARAADLEERLRGVRCSN